MSNNPSVDGSAAARFACDSVAQAWSHDVYQLFLRGMNLQSAFVYKGTIHEGSLKRRFAIADSSFPNIDLPFCSMASCQ